MGSSSNSGPCVEVPCISTFLGGLGVWQSTAAFMLGLWGLGFRVIGIWAYDVLASVQIRQVVEKFGLCRVYGFRI